MLAHVADEAHVEHAVGFVEHEDRERRRSAHGAASSGRAGGRAWRPGCRRRARSASTCGCWPTPPKITAWRRSQDGGHRCGSFRRSAARARASASGSARAAACGDGAHAVRRPGAAGSAARRPRSCRCRSARCRAGRCPASSVRDGLRLDRRRRLVVSALRARCNGSTRASSEKLEITENGSFL